MPDHALQLRALTKVYGARRGGPEKRALQGVDLDVPRGSFFALLGPNGAGKSTLINILAGLVLKTSGEVRIWDHDLVAAERQARLAIGVVPQELNLDPFFTPLEMLDVQAGLYGVPKSRRRSMELLDWVGLADKAGAYARSLSGGMQRRLLVAKAMVHSPPVLVLDEPTAGVDVALRRQLWTSLRELNRRGTTILLTTHYLEEAETLCDTIAIINQGRVAACAPTESLLGDLDCKELRLTFADDVSEGDLPERLRDLCVTALGPRQLALAFKPSQISAGQIISALRDGGLTIEDLTTKEAELEDVFLTLTGGTR